VGALHLQVMEVDGKRGGTVEFGSKDNRWNLQVRVTGVEFASKGIWQLILQWLN